MKTKNVLSQCIALALALCVPYAAFAAPPAKPSVKSVASGSNDLGFALMKEQFKAAPDANQFVSPASASLALAMLLNGANGTTADEIAQVLGVDASDIDALNLAYSELLDELVAMDPAIQLEIANAIFSDTTTPLNKPFVKTLSTSFKARARELDFRNDPDGACKQINAWASTNTFGKIPTILTNADPNTVAVLLNAVYLKAEWQSKFKKHMTVDDDFTNAAGTKQIPIMVQIAGFDYYSDADMQMIVLPYREQKRFQPNGPRLSMYVLLPGSNVGVTRLLPKLDSKTLAAYRSKCQQQRVHLELPKMKLEYSTELKDTLTKLGMRSAFQVGKADLSKMSSVTPLQVDSVLQKTFLAVDEDGTEAAAVTAIPISAGAAVQPPPKMVVNRPFLVFICDSQTGAILFCGVIAKPQP